jgi:hypothetical protein
VRKVSEAEAINSLKVSVTSRHCNKKDANCRSNTTRKSKIATEIKRSHFTLTPQIMKYTPSQKTTFLANSIRWITWM